MLKIFYQKRMLLLAVLLLIVMVAIFFTFFNKKDGEIAIPIFEKILRDDKEVEVALVDDQNKILISNIDGIQKIDLLNGQVQPASKIEQDDFSDFSGLLLSGTEENQNTEIKSILLSQDKKMSIVTVSVLGDSDENENREIISEKDFICDYSSKACQKTDILMQAYENLNPELQTPGGPLKWIKWDSNNGKLFGHIVNTGLGDFSPMYVCETENKKCAKTDGFDSLIPNDIRAVVPQGALSPTLGKFVMISQNDDPGLETGKKWELMIFDSKNPTVKSESYDISTIIDRAESVVYDSVQSVSWSLDEKSLAIGTSRRIFLMNLESGKISLAYVAPFDEDGDYYWDTSSLYLTSDNKSLVFIDSVDWMFTEDVGDLTDIENEPINTLKKIELDNSNVVKELFSSPGLSLKM